MRNTPLLCLGPLHIITSPLPYMVTEGLEIRTRPNGRRSESVRSDSLNIEIKTGGGSVCGEMELDDVWPTV